MNKFLIGGIGVVVVIGFALGVFGFMRGLQNSFNEDNNIIPTELVELFQDEMVSRGVQRIGQPIEGFDAFLLLQAFPGLQEQDFHGVASFEGQYTYGNGELSYQRTASMPVTSAEQTVSDAGYAMLLENIADRVGVHIENRSSVLEVINAVGGVAWQTATNAEHGVSFQYPVTLSATYIEAFDWPPQIQVLEEPFKCTEAGSETERAGKTEMRAINNRDYCVTTIVEGAAGSVYTQYAYAFSYNNQTAILTLSTRMPQCGNYSEPQKTECETERQTFRMDSLVSRMANTFVAVQ